MRAEDSSLWNDAQEAQKLMRERQGLEDGVKSVRELTQALEDNIGLIELGEDEGDQSVVDEFFGFRAHGWIGLSIGWSVESARNIGTRSAPVKPG